MESVRNKCSGVKTFADRLCNMTEHAFVHIVPRELVASQGKLPLQFGDRHDL